MNILFLFSRHSEDPKSSTLTKDLSDEFHRQGHQVTVVTLLEKKYNRKTSMKIENGYRVLRVRTGNYFDSPTKIEKGITAITMPYILKREILKRLRKEKFDLIFTHTPFISNPRLINSLKNHFKCKAMLNLWDIFPQNAIDLEMIKNKILLSIFRKTEREMYRAFDYIGCMSLGNIEFMKKHDVKYIANKYFLLKNWAILKERLEINKKNIREKYGYKDDEFISIFGGNMGKPQKLENLLELAKRVKYNQKIKFLFIGSGTEKEKLEKISNEKNLINIKFINQIPREDYELLTGACDLGLVSLDERFTVPNFPSKTTDYFKLGLPILASLDKCSANDYGVFLEKKVRAGLYALASEKDVLYNKFIKIYSDNEMRKEFSINGRKYYENELGVEKAYETITKKLNKML